MGKSRLAREGVDDFYDKGLNKWWDGYTGQKVVIMDDIGLEHKFIGHFLKRWADRYAIKGETKGGMVGLMHETFIVTS